MPAEARKLRLVAMTKNKKNPAYVGARLGADRVAARHGCVLTHAVPDKPDDIDEQHALLRAVHAERPDAVLIAPAHATALNGTLRAMQADGIRILCFVSRPEDFACTCFVGSDDRALARGIADYLFDRLRAAASRHAGGPPRRHHHAAARGGLSRGRGRAGQHRNRQFAHRAISCATAATPA